MKKDRRLSPFRRQVNEAFCSPDGSFSPTKFLAIWAQIAILFHLNVWIEKVLDKPETLLILLSFLIAPDLIRKIVNMKFGTK